VSLQEGGNGDGLGFNVVPSGSNAPRQILSLHGNGAVDVNGNLSVNGSLTSAQMVLLSLKVDGIDYKDAYLTLLQQMSILQAKLLNLTVTCNNTGSFEPRNYWDPVLVGPGWLLSNPQLIESTDGNSGTAVGYEWFTSGKHYCDFKIVAGGNMFLGVTTERAISRLTGGMGYSGFQTSAGVSLHYGGGIFGTGVQIGNDGLSYSTGAIVGVELDMAGHTIRFRRNGGPPWSNYYTVPADVYSWAVSTYQSGLKVQLIPSSCWHTS
jgi:hypothetical protein